MTDIRHPHPLILEGLTVRDALLLLGGHDDLVAKLSNLLPPVVIALHGGQAITLGNHIEAAKSCLPS